MKLSLVLPLAIALLAPSAAFAEVHPSGTAGGKAHAAHTAKRAKATPKPRKAAPKAKPAKAPKAAKKAPKASKKTSNR